MRLALPTPLLLALLALHTLQWTGLGLTQIFRQQDLRVSNPSSGGQILRPWGGPPLSPEPPFWPRADTTPLVLCARHLEPWAGRPASGAKNHKCRGLGRARPRRCC